ncbi:hypothetical protein RUND412_001798 [Rhizina undulata]
MTPTPPSSSGHSPQEQTQSNNNAYRVVRKRNRVPLSCAPCRSRKLKCNRAHPCENCVRRSDAGSCSYVTTPHASSSSSRARKHSAGSSPGSSDEMQSRIDRLEGLVLSLMSGNGTAVSPRDRERFTSSERRDLRASKGLEDEDLDDMAMRSVHEEAHETDEVEDDVEEVRGALGVMKVHCGRSFYRGETHWAAILSEITEVKNFFLETKQKYEDKLAMMKAQSGLAKLEATGFPFSAGKPPNKQELISLVPRRELVDVLVDGYFRNYDPIFHVLHRPTFYKQYEDFWQNTAKADTIWVGLLMAIMCLSLKIIHFSGEEPPELSGRTLEMSIAFKNATEQCLVVGEYTKKPYIHTIQAMILLTTAQIRKDHSDQSWLLLGTVVRLAMCMGLHRDPRLFGAMISPDEAEIRKRLWTVISCMDLLYSIEIGLPSMIRLDECDSPEPLNLHDDEISEHVTVLPPERGRNELTGVSYMIAKASMAKSYARIVASSNKVGPRPPYDQILKMDSELRELFAATPQFLRIRPTEECKTDPAWLIIQRYNLDLLFRKALVTLHRPYAAKAKTNPKYRNSRQQCVEAATILLNHQAEIFTDQKTTLRHAKWFTESLGSHDFLHAAMIICLDLSTSNKERKEGNKDQWELGNVDRSQQIFVLERAKEIYAKQKETSIEASKAFGVLTVMLDKLEGGTGKFDACTALHGIGYSTSKPPGGAGPGFPPNQASPPFCSDSATPSTSELTPASVSTPAFTNNAEPADLLNDPLKSEQAAAMTLGMMSGGGLTPNSAAAGLMFDRTLTATPGGNLVMGNSGVSGLGTSDVGSPSATGRGRNDGVLNPMGAPAFWPPMGIDLPSGLDWDEWDNFMQGINLDTSQMPGWPVLAGLTTGSGTIPSYGSDGAVRFSSPVGSGENAERKSTVGSPGSGGGGYQIDGMDINYLLRK